MAAVRCVRLNSKVAYPIREGEIVDGKYRVTRVLAEGGMGVVVAAQHLKLDQRVALKFMLPSLTRSPEAVERFSREARAAAKLQSEHVARILDVAELEDGQPYMVMEFLEGADLVSTIQCPNPPVVEEAVDYILQACDALAEAHALGIIHRDMKPENLFLTRRHGKPWIKVLDFGISKVLGDARREGIKITTQDAMGSPAYMSPEQMRATSEVDARSDIWSLGVILYEMLSRRQPFSGESLAEICIKVIQQPPPSLAALCPTLPPNLVHVIERCLEKNRDERFASVPDLVRALAPFAHARSQTVIAGALVFDDEETADAEPRGHSLPSISRTHFSRSTVASRSRSSRAPLLVLGGAVLIALVGWRPLARVLRAGEAVPPPVAAASGPPAVDNAVAPSSPTPAMDTPAQPAAPEPLAALPPTAPAATTGSEAQVATRSDREFAALGVPTKTSLVKIGKPGAPARPYAASKGVRSTSAEPTLAPRASAPAAKAPDEDVFSARK
jgi:eukaryotic-like serine/threonine-protein kinase